MQLNFTQSFEKEFKHLTKNNWRLKKKIKEQLSCLLKNPQHPSLRLHKLKNSYYWSISIDMSIRILFLYKNDGIYIYHVGKHEDVY